MAVVDIVGVENLDKGDIENIVVVEDFLVVEEDMLVVEEDMLAVEEDIVVVEEGIVVEEDFVVEVDIKVEDEMVE